LNLLIKNNEAFINSFDLFYEWMQEGFDFPENEIIIKSNKLLKIKDNLKFISDKQNEFLKNLINENNDSESDNDSKGEEEVILNINNKTKKKKKKIRKKTNNRKKRK
jgi:ABC-type proline/glycine betaine transport system ATPase subunit